MEFILENISLKILIQDTASLVISILIGFIIWVIKSSYDKYTQEINFLAKLEIYLVGDLATNTHNKEYLTEWVNALQKDNLYSCAFKSYQLDSSELTNTNNLTLINKVNTLVFGLNVLENDLINVYSGYQSNSIKLLEKDRVPEWKTMNKNILTRLEVFQKNFIDAEKDLKDTLIYLRAYHKQKTVSIYKIFSFFSINIYPFLTKINIENELNLLDKEIELKKVKK